jgi:hypothetical protein
VELQRTLAGRSVKCEPVMEEASNLIVRLRLMSSLCHDQKEMQKPTIRLKPCFGQPNQLLLPTWGDADWSQHIIIIIIIDWPQIIIIDWSQIIIIIIIIIDWPQHIIIIIIIIVTMQLELHVLQKKGCHLHALILIELYLGSKLYPLVLQAVGIRVSARYIRDFKIFNICCSGKNCPARCSSSTGVGCRNVNVLGTKNCSSQSVLFSIISY